MSPVTTWLHSGGKTGQWKVQTIQEDIRRDSYTANNVYRIHGGKDSGSQIGYELNVIVQYLGSLSRTK